MVRACYPTPEKRPENNCKICSRLSPPTQKAQSAEQQEDKKPIFSSRDAHHEHRGGQPQARGGQPSAGTSHRRCAGRRGPKPQGRAEAWLPHFRCPVRDCLHVRCLPHFLLILAAGGRGGAGLRGGSRSVGRRGLEAKPQVPVRRVSSPRVPRSLAAAPCPPWTSSCWRRRCRTAPRYRRGDREGAAVPSRRSERSGKSLSHSSSSHTG